MIRLKGKGMKTGTHVALMIFIAVITTLIPPNTYAGGRHHYYGHRHGYHHGFHYRGHGHHYSGHGFYIGLGLGLLLPLLYYNSYNEPERIYYIPEKPETRVTPQKRQTRTYARSDYCREYSRKIMIDGKESMAYGTACLQEDGRWRIIK